MAERLDGTVALVTGASSGIGAATARRLTALGATVAAVARRKDRLDDLVAEGGAALAIEADLTDRAQAEHAVQAVIDAHGRLDILVNNAGLMLLGTVEAGDPDQWDRMVQINVLGQLYVTRAATPHLLAAAEQEPRRVADLINISSSAGHQAYAINGVYALTKFGLNGFTESLRQEFAPRNVRVHGIAPGGVDTELFSHNSQPIQDAVLAVDFELLHADDIADTVEFVVTRPRRASVNSIWIGPTRQL
ncbi:SDR family oxidoreductase [Dactylosporangium sp. NPDC048998]|uniref:SDR family oxidoreductase n=1 Tax=Dactylosporangium sp. NPDC048998 TaxID=3363976 RepID=UPI003719B4C6